jgi:hypothetical protein
MTARKRAVYVRFFFAIYFGSWKAGLSIRENHFEGSGKTRTKTLAVDRPRLKSIASTGETPGKAEHPETLRLGGSTGP